MLPFSLNASFSFLGAYFSDTGKQVLGIKVGDTGMRASWSKVSLVLSICACSL